MDEIVFFKFDSIIDIFLGCYCKVKIHKKNKRSKNRKIHVAINVFIIKKEQLKMFLSAIKFEYRSEISDVFSVIRDQYIDNNININILVNTRTCPVALIKIFDLKCNCLISLSTELSGFGFTCIGLYWTFGVSFEF